MLYWDQVRSFERLEDVFKNFAVVFLTYLQQSQELNTIFLDLKRNGGIGGGRHLWEKKNTLPGKMIIPTSILMIRMG